MRLKLLLASLCTVSALLTGCTTDPAPTEMDLILSKKWKLTGMTASPAVVYEGSSITDIYASTVLHPCDKQQTRKYNADSTITYGSDSAGCIPPGFPSRTYAWSLTGVTLNTTEPDGDSLTGVEVKSHTLISINATTMVISRTVSGSQAPDGAAHVATETYTAQ